MTILAFYPVLNEMNWERHDFDGMNDEDAFAVLWSNRMKVDVRFYDMESHFKNHDTYGIGQYLMESDDFETDYNDEVFDGGWWVKSMHIPNEKVKEIIEKDERTPITTRNSQE